MLTLPDMIHSTRDPYAREKSGGVACYVRTESGVDAFASAGIVASAEQLLTPAEALRIFEAEPTTPTATPRDDHFDRQASLVADPDR